MNKQSFVRRHSTAIYFVVAFAISWIGTFLVIGPKFLVGEVIKSIDLIVMTAAMLNGPFIAGLLMTYLADGKQGLKEFYARLKKYKVAGCWYLPLLIFPVLLLCVSFVLSVFVSPELAPTVGFIGFISGPLAGLHEETGWMGFAYPKMKGKSNALATAIYLGVIHAIWHIVPDFLGSFGDKTGHWPLYFFGFCLHVVALRVLIVWVYSNTDSLFLSILMHASSTGFFGILIPTAMAPINWVIYYNVYGVALCLVASVIALKFGKTLKRNST